jgi:lipopolysaccharide export system permease protein
MDFMLNKDKLPDSANLQILYAFYQGANASVLIYPLALLFSMVITILTLVKKNEMIAFLSIGYSPKKLILPFLSLVGIVTIFFIVLQFNLITSFDEKAKAIKKGIYTKNVNKNLFFKFGNNTIFIQKLDIIQKKAYGMKVFVLDNNKLTKVLIIDKALFKNNSWFSDDVVQEILTPTKMEQKHIKLQFLKGFKPDILNKLESKSSMSLRIAIESLYLLNKEKIDTNFIKTYIYNAIIPPLSFVMLISILFLNAPIHSRISNTSLYTAISLFLSVVLWGVFLLIRKMAISGIVSADIVFLLPFAILLLLTIYYFRKI